MDYQNIKLEIVDGVATLTMNRPEVLNAASPDLAAEVCHALERLTHENQDRAARALVFTGAGRAFCSGADLGARKTGNVGDSLDTHYNPVIHRLYELPIPVICAINGPAAGVGCSFALAGDIVIAARSAYFLQAFINIGLVPDGGSTWILPRLVGKARAMQMMMLGEKITAEKAENWGLIYRMVEDAELASTAGALARKFADGPTMAYRMLRHGVRQAMEAGLSEGLQIERRNQYHATHSKDFVEGVTAFFEKRPARFNGS